MKKHFDVQHSKYKTRKPLARSMPRVENNNNISQFVYFVLVNTVQAASTHTPPSASCCFKHIAHVL